MPLGEARERSKESAELHAASSPISVGSQGSRPSLLIKNKDNPHVLDRTP